MFRIRNIYGNGYFLLFFVIAFLAACEQDSSLEESQSNEITGQAIASEILRACKYPNGEFCEEKCCQSKEKCEDGSFAFMECDLKSGEWLDKTYADSKCSSECKISNAEIEAEKPKENKSLKSCIEGWKCLNKFERIYRNADCSFGGTEKCSTNCINDTCAMLCTPGTFSCKNDILRKCDEDGMDWRYYTTCEDGCQNNTCITTTNASQTTNQTQNTTQEEDICDSACFSITEFHYDAEGNDNNNKNDEYVTIKNNCLFSCDLTDWEVWDAAISKPNKYKFSTFILAGDNAFTLYSGEGADTPSQLYWKKDGFAVWNNDGDTLYLKNQSGETIFSYSYS